MPPQTSTFKDTVLHQLHELGLVQAKAMFGGYGLYHDGIFFAIIANDQLYFKTNDTTRQPYLERGMAAFEFRPNQKKPKTYYEVPPDVLKDPSQLAIWARRAVDVTRV